MILVVEDNPRNLKLVRDVLDVRRLSDDRGDPREDGRRLAAAHRPDLILMDLQLPGIDGAEALRQIRPTRRRPAPVVAVTAFAMNNDRDALLRRRLRRLRREADQRARLPGQVQAILARRQRHERAADTILVVDDQPPNVRLLEAVLGPRGYDVRGGVRARRRWARSAAATIDLVLLDIVMPGMDGYEVCRGIRDDPAPRTCRS